MNDILGLQLSLLLIVLSGTLAFFAICLALIAWRHRIIFTMGTRNVPRRKSQSALIVLGLMLSTLIMAAALGTGDTLHSSLANGSYASLGEVDELIVVSSEPLAPNVDTNATFPFEHLASVEKAVSEIPNVDGVMPMLSIEVAAQDQTSSQSEPGLNLVGIDLERLDQFGGMTLIDGSPLDPSSLGLESAVLSSLAAEKLNASAGDRITLFINGQATDITVAGITEDSVLSGYWRGRDSYIEHPGIMMPLSAVQEMSGNQGLISAIALSNTGDAHSGAALTDDVRSDLVPYLTATGLGIDAYKQSVIDDGERIAGMFTSIFMVLGLFSIMSGLLLIVLIFTMLAAERRSEMGMARAVGMGRSQLVQQFISEGAVYALLAGIVGSILGVGAAYAVGQGMGLIFGKYVEIHPHVDLRSMAVAFCLGVLITFVTVIASSWKVSRLNIVAAIRDIPDLPNKPRPVRQVVFGLLLLAGGGLLTFLGLSGESAALFLTGMSLVPFGVALLLRLANASSRLVFSLAGLFVIALWLLPEGIRESLFGNLDGDIELFFLAGMFLVVASTLVIMQNTMILLRAISWSGGLFRSTLPAVRTAVAYPAAARGRTGMTIAMFSLIIFSLVMMATMSTNFAGSDQADAGWDIRTDVPGRVTTAQMEDRLAANGVDLSGIQSVGMLTSPGLETSELRLSGEESWKQWPVFGMDDLFIANSDITYQQRANGYETDEDVRRALASEPNVAVIDSFALPEGGLDSSSDSAFSLAGVVKSGQKFDPITIELADRDGDPYQVKIIGIISEEVSTLYGLYSNQRTVDSVYATFNGSSMFLALTDPTVATEQARVIEASLLATGGQSVAIEDELRDAAAEENGFLYLIEGFMGLGLLVGVAAVGVVSFRSVVERRQQIGVLRALGFQRSLVSLGFMIEIGFVVGVGIISGSVLGVGLAINLLNSESSGTANSNLTIPWMLIATIAVGTILSAMLMTWIPSRQAGRIAPAEALRYE